jgi:hypothetical protein
MAEKKDIGELFENKLSEGVKTPQDSLWGKINTSLNKELRRKKRVILFWTLGTGLSLALIFFIIFNYEAKTLDVNKTDSNSKENTSTILKKESSLENVYPNENLQNDQLNNQVPSEKNSEDLKKITFGDSLITAKKNSKVPEKNLSGEDGSKQKMSNEKNSVPSKKNTVDESFSVTKKYYYYNSKNKNQIITTNKSVIDSLVNDTLSIKKMDSIEKE